MRKSPLSACVVAVLAAGALVVGAPPAAADRDGTYIVVYKPGARPDAAASALERAAATGPAGQRFRTVVNGFAARLSPAEVSSLERDPAVAYVVPDRPVSTTVVDVPLERRERVPTGVLRVGAATATHTQEPSGAAVAVVDTGVSVRNRDLNVVDGVNCVPGEQGRRPDDQNGHGSHVAGTIGALNNGRGVVGVAPGTRMYSVKVLDRRGSGTFSTVICGLEWVAENASRLGIKVANLSLGGGGSSDGACGTVGRDPLHQAVCAVTAQGVTVVAAAGNSGVDLQGFAPAAYPEVLAVTAMTDTDSAPGGAGRPPRCSSAFRHYTDDTAAGFSNFATRPVDRERTVAAPGVCVLSTWRGTGRRTISGTSMAALHVAAAVALCLDAGSRPGPCDGLTPAQVVARIVDDAGARPAAEGFVGDPNAPYGPLHYGPLVDAGAY